MLQLNEWGCMVVGSTSKASPNVVAERSGVFYAATYTEQKLCSLTPNSGKLPLILS